MQTQSSHPSRENKPKTLVTQIQQNDWFRSLTVQISKLQHLQKLFVAAVGVTLGEQCRVLEIKDSCLSLQVENAVWSTTLRYQAPDIVKKLQKIPEFADVKTLRGQIYHNPWPQSQTMLKPNAISSVSVATIIAMADSIQDGELREKMLKLGRNT